MYARENLRYKLWLPFVRQETLLLTYDQDLINDEVINDEEFVLLYSLNTSKNFDYSCWNYSRFDLDDWSDKECRSDLRFYKADIFRLFEVLNIPVVLITYNQSKFDGMEAFCFLRFSYPFRFSDLVSRFGRPVLERSMISNATLDYVYNNFNHSIILISPGIDPYCYKNIAERYMKKEHP